MIDCRRIRPLILFYGGILYCVGDKSSNREIVSKLS